MTQGHQARRIIGADGAKADGGPIAQDDDLVDIAGNSLDSNGLPRVTQDLSRDAHDARPSRRGVTPVNRLGRRRFIVAFLLAVETSRRGGLDSAASATKRRLRAWRHGPTRGHGNEGAGARPTVSVCLQHPPHGHPGGDAALRRRLAAGRSPGRGLWVRLWALSTGSISGALLARSDPSTSD